MRKNTVFLQGVCLLTSVMVLLGVTSCGTIMYPERRGQTSGQIDVGVVVLDGIGLLFFLVPGVIAFAVDFGTGAIYLPPDHPESEFDSSTVKDAETLQVDRTLLTRQGIETLITEKTGQAVDLASTDVKVAHASGDHQPAWNSIEQVLSSEQLIAFDNQAVQCNY
jgi:hypothetical protein